MSDNPQKTTNRMVPAWYYTAFSLKAMGFSYWQIAEKVGKREDTVRHLFCVSGALHELWRAWLSTAQREAIDESLMIMYAHLPDIVRHRAIQAKQNNMIGVISSQMIMGYTLGKPDAKSPETSEAIMTFAEWIKEQTLKRQAQQNGSTGTGEGRTIPTIPKQAD